jgi:hypothetical protein
LVHIIFAEIGIACAADGAGGMAMARTGRRYLVARRWAKGRILSPSARCRHVLLSRPAVASFMQLAAVMELFALEGFAFFTEQSSWRVLYGGNACVGHNGGLSWRQRAASALFVVIVMHG